MTMKSASFCCLLTTGSGLTTEPTEMVLSVLWGVTEKVLSCVLIRNHSVICWMLRFDTNLVTGLWSPTKLENL